mgnify:CR=1 FL=1
MNRPNANNNNNGEGRRGGRPGQGGGQRQIVAVSLRVVTGYQAEQRGFSGTVAAHQAGFFTGVDGGVDAIEQHLGAAAQGDIFKSDHQEEKNATRAWRVAKST